MSLRFSWYAPTHGDGRIIGGQSPELAWSPGYINRVAAEAEAAGFDMILIPAGPSCADGIVTAAHIAQATTTLRCLIAVRPGAMPPTVLAKAAATLDHLSAGRLSINIVAGGSPAELAMDGDHEPHDRRYMRAREFLTVLRAVWGSDGVSYAGEFFQIRDAALRPKPLQEGGPPIYLGGTSPSAIQVAAEAADVYLMWGEPSDAVAEQISKVDTAARSHGRRLRFGIRINLIVERTSAAAWERALAMRTQVDLDMAARARAYIADSDSMALSRIQALWNEKHHDPAFWTGMVPFRSGNSTALVGSVEDVVSSLQRYVDAGVSEFIFSAYPHHETVEFVGSQILSALRACSGDVEG